MRIIGRDRSGHGWGGGWGGGWGQRGPWGPAIPYPFYVEDAVDGIADDTKKNIALAAVAAVLLFYALRKR